MARGSSKRRRIILVLGIGVVSLLYCAEAFAQEAPPAAAVSSGAGPAQGGSQMEKKVTEQASFVAYVPPGWVCKEGAQEGFRTVSATDPSGQLEVAVFYGANPAGTELATLAKHLLERMGGQFPDLDLRRALTAKDGPRMVLDGVYTDPQKGRREFRCWLSRQGGDFTCLRAVSPEGQLAEKRSLLLTVLSNIRVAKGAFKDEGGVTEAELVSHRLRDGSASFKTPSTWRVQELGAAQFIANDPTGAYSFISANVTVLTPQLGVRVPNTPISPFLGPHQALQFLTAQGGIARDMRFLEVTPRPEIAQQMALVYTSGPVIVEDFLYTCTSQAGRVKGYTLGISFGSYLGANWSFRHLTVAGPEDTFDAFAPTFATMLQSYAIDEEWAKNYIAQGVIKLRGLQKQTSQIVARNADEIRQTMQAAYDERQRSQDYIDYQRTNYIRGEQDWISHVEGCTIYHTDNWGTKNTATGEYWQGQPYDYVHFEGDNPKYREQMTPVDTRQLWEQRIR